MKKCVRPVGIFDSGFGGLTVLRQLRQILPREKFIYFGDTARVPYGTKSAETIRHYSEEIMRFLLTKKVKMVVIACNTSSALALKYLEKKFPVLLCGVIEPGAALALKKSSTGQIGVIGTEATIRSQVYPRVLKRLAGKRAVQVFSLATPLLVPLVEEGITDGLIAELVVKNYLQKFSHSLIDTLILGCTHYPLLKNTIHRILDERIFLVDSAVAVADRVKELLQEHNLLNPDREKVAPEFYVTDFPQKFQQLGQKFLQEKIVRIKLVKFW